MKRGILIVILLLLRLNTYCQTFQWQATVPFVEQDGFYNIVLVPEITGQLKKDFSDIRLYDKNEQVPYILREETPVAEKFLFREYRIVENAVIKNCCTRLVLENTNRSKINNISLIIRNADVQKTARLSGSDDLENWYVIKERYILEGFEGVDQTYEARVLDFPLSNYSYYRLEIVDSASAPLNIMNAGFYDRYSEIGKYLTLPKPQVIQKDSSDRHTYLWIKYDQPQLIDKIKFWIEQPPFYYRKAQICTFRFDKRNKKQLIPIQNFELKSGKGNDVLTDFQASEFCILIDNEDNPPLEINDFQGFQLVRYLTAYLKAGQEYQVKFGNEKVHRPDYDLRYFNENIPEKVPNVEPIGISKIESAIVKGSDGSFISSRWIWSVIIVIIGVLGYMSWRMVGEMKKES